VPLLTEAATASFGSTNGLLLISAVIVELLMDSSGIVGGGRVEARRPLGLILSESSVILFSALMIQLNIRRKKTEFFF
jgi:hypothetical protein